MGYRIKNWGEFQHFKDRTPPWIKLYRKLLDDMEWHLLDPQPAKTLVSLWLIASEYEGSLPDVKKLAFRLRLSEKQVSGDISKLSHWLEQDDINVISPRYQDDPLETETETERDRVITPPTTDIKPVVTKTSGLQPDDVNDEVWQDWCQLRKTKKTTVSNTVLKEARTEADKAGMSLERFLAVWVSRGSQGLQADWLKPNERGGGSVIPMQSGCDPTRRFGA